MHMTVWVYPWDVARLGAASVLDDIEAHGLDGVNLAATYHPISALSPRGASIRGFFCPRGAVFFPARPQRYGRVVPQVWPDRDVVGAWTDLANSVADRGLELNAWTIVLFQPWLAQDHPELARVQATGDVLDAGVCPSNPDLHEYVVSLVGDLADQFPLATVKLEGVAPPAFDYGWIRRRIYFELSAVQERLLGLCFCAACTGRAAADGIEVQGVRRRVVDALAYGSDADPFADDPETAAYARVAPAASAALVRQLADLLGGPGGTELAVPSPWDGAGLGLPIEEVVDHVACVLFTTLRRDPAAMQAAAEVIRGRTPRPHIEYFVHPPPSAPGSGGIPHGILEDLADPQWHADLRTAIELGADRLSLYHHGLLTPATFDRLHAAAEAAGR